ncbi:MAG: UDP-3-O-(3-hydroxymyristoyl)glucosamine N-acyltransferase [Pirellulales bacterium]|nr:UDP-3-O-(3-hydroxymyristoyl)glucosamine N-acyltransferase [Pirellulales bacterium]
MQATLAELAALVDGQLIGDGDLVIHGASPMNHAVPGQITLTDDCPDRHYDLSASRASAILASRSCESTGGLPTIQVEDVHAAFAKIIRHFNPPRIKPRSGVSPLAVISPSAKLDENVDVHPYATVGDDVFIGSGSTIHSGVHIMAGSKIGSNVTVYPNAVIYEDTIIGANCIIHGGAVLGANGFGYTQVEGRHVLSAQLGNVILGANVEVGAGATIDRGTYGPTTIGEGTKIDNLVMVAHNCQIGRHNMLCSQVGIAGSTTTGDYVVMAGQVGVRDHVHIGQRAVLGAMAGIINDVAEGSQMIGVPATPHRDQKLKQAAFSKLPEMRRQLKILQRTVDKLVEQQANKDNDPRKAA